MKNAFVELLIGTDIAEILNLKSTYYDVFGCIRLYAVKNKTNRTIGYSFRIREKFLKILRKDARSEGISVNALVNRILEDYCEYHRFAQRFKRISLTHTTFVNLINSCPEDRLQEIAEKSGSVVMKDVFQTIPIPQTYTGLTNFLAKNISKHSGWFDFYHHSIGGKEIFHLRHDMGEKWSKFIAKQLSTTFSFMLDIKTKTETFRNYATIQPLQTCRSPFQPVFQR